MWAHSLFYAIAPEEQQTMPQTTEKVLRCVEIIEFAATVQYISKLLQMISNAYLSNARHFEFRHQNHQATGQDSNALRKTRWWWQLVEFKVALHASDAKC